MSDLMLTPGEGGGGKPPEESPPKPYDPLSSIQAPKPPPKPYDPLSSIQAPKPPPKPYDPLSSIQAPKPPPKPYDPLSSIQAPKPPPEPYYDPLSSIQAPKPPPEPYYDPLSSIQAPKPPPEPYYDPLSSIQAPAGQRNTENVPRAEAWQNQPWDPVVPWLLKHFGHEIVGEMFLSESTDSSDGVPEEEDFDHFAALLAHASGIFSIASLFAGYTGPSPFDYLLMTYHNIRGEPKKAIDVGVGVLASIPTLGIPIIPFLHSKMQNSPYEDPYFYAEFPSASGSNRNMHGEVYQNREEAMYRGYQFEYINPHFHVGGLNPTVDLFEGFNIVEDLSEMDASEVDIGSRVDEWITVVGGWKAATTDFAGSGENEKMTMEAFFSFELFFQYVRANEIDLDNVADDKVLPHLVQAMARRGVVLPNEVIAVTLMGGHYTLSNEMPSGLLPSEYQARPFTPEYEPVSEMYDALSENPELLDTDFQTLERDHSDLAQRSSVRFGWRAEPIYIALQTQMKREMPRDQAIPYVIGAFSMPDVNYEGTGFATLEDAGGPNRGYRDLSVQELLDQFRREYPDYYRQGRNPADYFARSR